MKTTSQTVTPEGFRVIHLPNRDAVRADAITAIRRIDAQKSQEFGGGYPPRVCLDIGDNTRRDVRVLKCENDDEMHALADDLMALWTGSGPALQPGLYIHPSDREPTQSDMVPEKGGE